MKFYQILSITLILSAIFCYGDRFCAGKRFPCDGDMKFDVILVFKQKNIDILENMVLDISNPTSKNYGKYLSKIEIRNLVSPSDSDLIEVKEWLYQHNISNRQIKSYGDMWKIRASIDKLNILLRTDLKTSYDTNMLKTYTNYTIPVHLQHIIEFVGGIYAGDNYREVRKPSAKQSVSPDRGYVGREVACRLYSMNCSHSVHNVSAGAVEYQSNAGFSLQDVHMSQKNNGENMTNMSKIIGNNFGINTESELDVQMISQTAQNVDLWYLETSGWLYEFASTFFDMDVVPDVISMSWGWAEDKQCEISSCTSSENYVRRVNNEYLKIVARGVTIVASSGDAGAPGRTSENCDPSRPVNAVFPTSSPWVTSVGATFVSGHNNVSWNTSLCTENDCASGMSEHTTNFVYTSWTAGGGFSRYTTRIAPYWQKDVVEQYLNSSVPLPSNFGFGRAYPDVTVFGHNCPSWIDGGLTPVDGTSCSSPVFAGIVAILNDYMVSHGKPKLGYLNPLLYKMYNDDKEIFKDLIVGNNWCTEYQCCPTRADGGSDYGYLATTGYDPVTGLGTPNITRMMKWLEKNM